MIMEPFQWAFLIGVFLIISEIVVGGFILLGLGIAVVITAASMWVFGGFQVTRDLLILLVCAPITIGLLKIFMKRKVKQEPPDVNHY